MKFVIVLTAVLAVASAQYNRFQQQAYSQSYSQPAPAPSRVVKTSSSDQAANIIRSETDGPNPDGSYNFAFETDNGIAVQAQGTPRDFGGNPPIVPVVAQGAFSWQSPEGEPIAITYVADENGYQPSGAAIPTPPPVPPQIARALEYLARAN